LCVLSESPLSPILYPYKRHNIEIRSPDNEEIRRAVERRELTTKEPQMEQLDATARSLAELPSVRVGFLDMVDAFPSPWNTIEKPHHGAAFLIVVTCRSSMLLLSPSLVGGPVPVWNS
jgi:hypothetical protein